MNKLRIGVDYYPEHWGLEMLQNDISIMKEAGIGIVRMAEFAWCRMEPREGEYDFSWLRTAVDAFTEADIQVVLCTPTCTPPFWAFRDYPEIVQWDRSNEVIQTGVRGHRCLSSRRFRDLSRKIIVKMCEEFKDDKNVVAWQIDNELEANYCSCPECTDYFRDWLRKKYSGDEGLGGLDDGKILNVINETYGNVVWSGEYSSFEDILTPPAYPNNWLNPSYMLDHLRFANDSTKEYIDFQANIIRDIIPDAYITTNAWYCENSLDHHKAFKDLDFASYDNYPSTDVNDLSSRAYRLDMIRGIKDQNFWIMEQLTGIVGSWMPMQPAPVPGMIKGYALQAIAHGADNVLHFRFRTARKGAEMFWHGLLEQGDLKGRKFKEFKSLCEEVTRLSEAGVGETTVKSEAAILYSYEDDATLKFQKQTDNLAYIEFLKKFHNAFTRLCFGVDVVNPEVLVNNGDGSTHNPLSKYKIVVVLPAFIRNKTALAMLEDYAKKGGCLIICPRSGVKDEYNNLVDEVLPGDFSRMAGIQISEYDPLGKRKIRAAVNDKLWIQVQDALAKEEDRLAQMNVDSANDDKASGKNSLDEDLSSADNQSANPNNSSAAYSNFIGLGKHLKDRNDLFSVDTWADIIEPTTAKTIAKYLDGFYGFKAAITENTFYNGNVIYFGTLPEDSAIIGLLARCFSKMNIPLEVLPEGVEVTRRVGDTGAFTFIFNNNSEQMRFTMDNREISIKPFELIWF
ncbi:MAG: beta-galactosidase [Lachnospiraceae bacterium]|nr:beta-galactosidase [Lachnospiraceae bacterium]